MIFSAALSDAWDGFLEDAFTDLAHLAQDGFEFSMVGNGSLVERDLLRGEGDGERLGFDFACQTPGPRGLEQDTALSDPAEIEQLLFQAPVALLESAGGLRELKEFFWRGFCLSLSHKYIYCIYMRNPTPFFAAFAPLLFGRPPRAFRAALRQSVRRATRSRTSAQLSAR